MDTPMLMHCYTCAYTAGTSLHTKQLLPSLTHELVSLATHSSAALTRNILGLQHRPYIYPITHTSSHAQPPSNYHHCTHHQHAVYCNHTPHRPHTPAPMTSQVEACIRWVHRSICLHIKYAALDDCQCLPQGEGPLTQNCDASMCNRGLSTLTPKGSLALCR